MEQRKKELDSWDALVKKMTNSLQTPILREMDQCCPWVPKKTILKQVPRTSSVHPVPYHILKESVLALLNLENELNAIYLTFAKELALRVRLIA